jgi:hypothetical protein
MGIRIRIGGLKIGSSSQSWASYWTPQSIASKVLFWGKVSEIAGGEMPNKVTGATDHLTATGSPLAFQCPNAAPYIAADTDYIWFKTNGVQRAATTTAELIGYDLQRTPVKYGDVSPNTLEEIIILKTGETLTTSELNNLFAYMHLSMFWDGTQNDNGYLKDNRTGQQLWTPESVQDAATTAFLARLGTGMSAPQIAALDVLIVAAKAHGWWTPMGVIRLLHLHNANDSLLNVKADAFNASLVLTPNFTAYSGWVSDEAGAGINNNYIPSSAGDMTQDDASFFEYFTGFSAAESNRFAGATDGTRLTTIGNATLATFTVRINEAAATTTAYAGGDLSALHGVVRSGATTKMLLFNADKQDDTDVSTGLPTVSLYSGCLNNNGSGLYGGSVRTVKAVLIGKAISQAVFNLIKSDLETFFTAFVA